jgi:membrane protein implicated in regulation of membrane protease activity
MFNSRSLTWLDRLLIAGIGVVLLTLGLLAFTVLVAFLSVAALVLAVRGWWMSKRVKEKVKDNEPLTLEGDYQVVPRSHRE